MLYILGFVVLAVAAGLVFSPSFRQLLRIRSSAAVKSGSTAVEKEKDIITQLMAKLPAQRQAVASVMANVDAAQRAYDAKKAEADQLFAKYQQYKGMNASADVLTQTSTQWQAAKAALPTLEGVLAEAHKNADDAQKALNSTIEALKKEQANIQSDEAKAQLAAAIRQNAQVQQQLQDLKNGLGTLADARKEVDADLDKARAENQLSQGTAADREMAALDEKAAAASAQSAIEAEIAKQSGGTK